MTAELMSKHPVLRFTVVFSFPLMQFRDVSDVVRVEVLDGVFSTAWLTESENKADIIYLK